MHHRQRLQGGNIRHRGRQQGHVAWQGIFHQNALLRLPSHLQSALHGGAVAHVGDRNLVVDDGPFLLRHVTTQARGFAQHQGGTISNHHPVQHRIREGPVQLGLGVQGQTNFITTDQRGRNRAADDQIDCHPGKHRGQFRHRRLARVGNTIAIAVQINRQPLQVTRIAAQIGQRQGITVSHITGIGQGMVDADGLPRRRGPGLVLIQFKRGAFRHHDPGNIGTHDHNPPFQRIEITHFRLIQQRGARRRGSMQQHAGHDQHADNSNANGGKQFH